MPKKVFYSFHFKPDKWRVGQVRSIGVIEDNPAAEDHDWHEIVKKGDLAIQNWIDNSLKDRVCTVVLIGQHTFQRKWVRYEIEKSWKDKKGLVGIYIHGLKNEEGLQAYKGDNPLASILIGGSNIKQLG